MYALLLMKIEHVNECYVILFYLILFQLFNKILNEFVTSWYSTYTKDESFVLELRRCMRYAASVLLRRVLQVCEDSLNILCFHAKIICICFFRLILER